MSHLYKIRSISKRKYRIIKNYRQQKSKLLNNYDSTYADKFC